MSPFDLPLIWSIESEFRNSIQFSLLMAYTPFLASKRISHGFLTPALGVAMAAGLALALQPQVFNFFQALYLPTLCKF